ncbi:Histone-fold,Transcription initiation factor TFIID, subunit 12 [Cinara cedri]|uniref:Transcription initiation factor TFIID subunit 12 n=1 Tax=Cinara cedri TaxID=506608 RepID=A0A5E4N3B0_9HEMI|nr:Histone-fold,Transcription initiation factor TFIID, subunit 12 [Cinara cedri]
MLLPKPKLQLFHPKYPVQYQQLLQQPIQQKQLLQQGSLKPQATLKRQNTSEQHNLVQMQDILQQKPETLQQSETFKRHCILQQEEPQQQHGILQQEATIQQYDIKQEQEPLQEQNIQQQDPVQKQELLQQEKHIVLENAVNSNIGTVLTRTRLRELINEVDPNEQLDLEVEDLMMQLSDDFIEEIIKGACSFSKHRKSNIVEAQDVQIYLDRYTNIQIPSYNTHELKPNKKAPKTEAHRQRMALIKKTIAPLKQEKCSEQQGLQNQHDLLQQKPEIFKKHGILQQGEPQQQYCILQQEEPIQQYGIQQQQELLQEQNILQQDPVLTRTRLRELINEVDPNEQLDLEVEDLMMQLSDDFIEEIIKGACSFSKHRKSNIVEAQDVQIYLGN